MIEIHSLWLPYAIVVWLQLEKCILNRNWACVKGITILSISCAEAHGITIIVEFYSCDLKHFF